MIFLVLFGVPIAWLALLVSLLARKSPRGIVVSVGGKPRIGGNLRAGCGYWGWLSRMLRG